MKEDYRLEGLSLKEKEAFFRISEIFTTLETISPHVSGDQAFRLVEEIINQVKFLVTTQHWWAFQRTNPDLIVGQSNTSSPTGELVESKRIYRKGIQFPPFPTLGRVLDALAIVLKTIREDNLEKGFLPPEAKFLDFATVIEETILNNQVPDTKSFPVKPPKKACKSKTFVQRYSTLSDISKALNSSQSPNKKVDSRKKQKSAFSEGRSPVKHTNRSRKSNNVQRTKPKRSQKK